MSANVAEERILPFRRRVTLAPASAKRKAQRVQRRRGAARRAHGNEQQILRLDRRSRPEEDLFLRPGSARVLYTPTAEGDPNTGIIVGDEACTVVDAQATPVMAQRRDRAVRSVTDKPIRYVMLIALSCGAGPRRLGLSRAPDHRDDDARAAMIVERGEQDMDSEMGRFPRLFRAPRWCPGLVWPTSTFHGRMSCGSASARCASASGAPHGRRHHRPCARTRVVFSATSSNTARPAIAATLISPTGPRRSTGSGGARREALVAGVRRRARLARQGRRGHRDDARLPLDPLGAAKQKSYAAGLRSSRLRRGARAHGPEILAFAIYEHCLPFNVSRAYDEARGHRSSGDLDGGARPRDVGRAAGLIPARRDRAARRCFATAIPARPTRTARGPRTTRWLSSAPARSGLRSRSISRCAAFPWCSSTMPTASARARAASATPSARWRSSTGSASPSMVEKGVTWKLGKVFRGDELLYRFDLLPEDGPQDAGLHQPAAISTSSSFLVERALQLGDRSICAGEQGDRLERATMARGSRSRRRTATIALDADWVIACDGARSTCATCSASVSRARSSRTSS